MAKRGQRGSVRIESGNWYGYFNTYVFEDTPDEGIVQKRKQKCVKLGPAEGLNKLSKWDAYGALAKEIEKARGTSTAEAKRDGTITLKDFAEKHWKPTKESKWRPSSKKSANYILSTIYEGKNPDEKNAQTFGSMALEKLDRSDLQKWLNQLAKDRSASIVKHAKHYIKSILELAVDDDYLTKNIAKRLEIPKVRKVSKTTLTVEEFKEVMKELESPFDLLVKVGIACALRPSELLALRWRDLDVKTKTFTIHETVYRGQLRPFTKTTGEDETDKSLLTVPVWYVLVECLCEYHKR
ncbi:MAG TPA: site-specific integrase [Candidatus Eisenbacteria bacterium]|nr:site-specific integrase [Candidatus Eisenbacteria bacterium]